MSINSVNDIEEYPIQPPKWYYGASKNKLTELIPTSVENVLEIGCGEGNLGEYIKERFGAEVWGIELNKAAAEKAKNKLDKVFPGDAAVALDQIQNKKFDCIIMFDVLEHMVNPWVVMKKLKTCLSGNGKILLVVPNVMYASNLFRLVIKKDWKYISHGVLDITHLRFFTRKSLCRFIDESGYEIINIQGYRPLKGKYLWPYYLLNLISMGYYRDIKFTQFSATIRLKK